MGKDFYVSPFLEMRGSYTVRVRDEPSRLRITINHEQRDGLSCTPASTSPAGP